MKTIFLVLMFAFFHFSFASEPDLALQKMEAEKDFTPGCGCIIMNSHDEILVFSGLDAKGPAVVRILKKDKQLNCVSSTQKNDPPKKGDTFTRKYELGDMVLDLKFKTTFACAKDDESCEVNRFSVDLNMKDGKKPQLVMKGLRANCGC